MTNSGRQSSGHRDGADNALPLSGPRVEVRGRGALAAGGDVQGNAIGEHSAVVNIITSAVRPISPSVEDIKWALTAYAARIRESYGRLDLEVLTPLSEQGEHPVVQLREVFVPPQVRSDPPPVDLPRELLQRLIEHGEIPGGQQELPPGVGPDALKRGSAYRERPAVPVLEVVAGTIGRRLVVLGDPGGGKSTLARYLALTLTQPDMVGPLAALGDVVPVVVEVRSYAEERWRDRTFEDFLQHMHQTEGMAPPRTVMESLLKAGQAFVMFDGLDELFDPAVRAETARRIAGFASRYPAARVMVTSRVIGYQRGFLDGAGFTHYMLQDLTEREIGEFARRWYAIGCPGDPALAGQLVQRITSAVGNSRPVRELAGNPLLLTILAIIGRRQTLPRDRQGVYRHAVTVLVAHWDQDAKHLVHHGAPEALQILDDDDRHELLRLLARRMQDGQSGIAGNHIHATELEAVFREYFQQYELPPLQTTAATRAMVNQLRERNFILSLYGGEVYGFVHRAFLEYLAAADIVHRYTHDREWNPEELVEEIFARRACDPAWHEVLLLTIGQLSEADAARAIDRLLEIHAHRTNETDHRVLDLAVGALAEVKKIAKLQLQSNAVVDGIIEMVGYDSLRASNGAFDWRRMAPALLSFNEYWIGRQRYLRWFHAWGQHLRNSSKAAAIAGLLYPAPDILSFLAREAQDAMLRLSAVTGLGARWPESDSVRALLAASAIGDSHNGPRRAALRALAAHWPDEETRILLADRAVNDPDEETRKVALFALAENWPDDDTRALLFDRAINDRIEWTRSEAFRALAAHWPDEETRNLLADRAVNDPDEDSREAALDALAENWPDDDTRALLFDRAVNDQHEWCREAALYSIVEFWPTEGTRALLVDRAINDQHEWSRSSALRVLAQQQPDEETRILLVDRAVKDRHEWCREAALRALAEYWSGDASTRALLTDSAINDPKEVPRRTALRALAAHWPDEETRILLVDRAVNDRHEWCREEALRVLAAWWPKDHVKRALLIDRAGNDSNEGVRSVALGTLAELCSEDEETRRLLIDRAVNDPSDHVRLAAIYLWAVVSLDDPGPCLAMATDGSAAVRIKTVQVLAFMWPNHPAVITTLRRCAERDEHEQVRSAAEYALRVSNFLAI